MKKSILIVIQFSLLLILIGCGTKETETLTSAETTEASADVTVTKAQFSGASMQLGRLKEASFPNWVAASGMIDVPP